MSQQTTERAPSLVVMEGLVCTDDPVDKCIHEMVEAQVARTPDAVAVVYQGDRLTYRELNERANKLAAHLMALGVTAETPVAICVERSIEMVVGVLGILKAGGYYVPLDPAYPVDRLAWMLEDTSAFVLLKERHLLPDLSAHTAQVLFLDEVWDGEGEERAEQLRGGKVSSDQIANVLYTSGSTGKPKGIAMSHRALRKVLEWQIRRLNCDEGTKTAQFASLCFDVSFLEMFSALSSGGTLVLVSEALRLDPIGLWRFLIDEQIEILFVPFVTLQQLAEVSAVEDEAPTSLREIASSGEQLYITPDVVRLFQRLKDTVLDNLYGPTESHAAMEFELEGSPEQWPQRPPIGRAIAHAQIYLLDENLEPVPSDAEGEIYIGGAGLARGYLRRPRLTAERFIPNPFSRVPGARMYRTGDRARLLASGVIEYIGRIDHQLKIRGFRVEPEEIESELMNHPSIRAAAVAPFEDENRTKRLVAYFVADESDSLSNSALRRFLQTRLPDYMIPSVFVSLQSLPISPNGKLDRRALPQPETVRPDLDTDYVAPRTPLEEQVAAIWADTLGVSRVGINDNFFELGGHSLLATRLLSRLHESIGAHVRMRSLFESPTVAALAIVIAEHQEAQAREAATSVPLAELTPAPHNLNQPFPLTDVQQAYWIGRSGAFELGGVASHIYVELEVGGVELSRVERVIRKLIERHAMLRAIILPDGRQQILEDVPPYEISLTDLRGQGTSETEAQLEATRQEMSHHVLPAHQWPLFEIRASLRDERRTRFHISYDLLIGDLRSLQILIREFVALYGNEEAPLSELALSFRDYVMAESELQEALAFKQSKAYWQDRLATMPPAPDLPLARRPDAIRNQRFTRRSASLEPEQWQQLKSRAAHYSLTPSAILLAAYAEVLTAWSASPRFTLNLPILNRLPVHPEVNDIVGDFTSVSLLAIDNSSPASFIERAQRIQQQLWDDLGHRHYSGVRVMRELALSQRGTSRAAMPVVFTSTLNMELSRLETALLGWADEVVFAINQTPQVWLDHQVGEYAGALLFNWDAVEELFPDELLDAMFDSYCRLLHQLSENDESWSALSRQLLPPSQLAQRAAINDTAAPVNPILLHTPFVEQARQNPHRPAIISTRRNLTYEELDRLSNAVAGSLRRLRVRPGTLVAVVMEKGWEQVAAVLGILKAGAAYLPLDPQLPRARRYELLADAEVEVALTQAWLAEAIEWPDGVRVETVGREREAEESEQAREEASESGAGAEQEAERDWEELAYVIYTSGSTGFPKGVMIDHRGAVNTILDINRRFGINSTDRVLALSALNFDLSVYDIFGTLAAGGAIVLPDAGDTRDPSNWAQLIEQEGVTIWNSVPALMEMLVEYVAESDASRSHKLRTIMLSGDWIPAALPGKIRSLFKGADIISLGGATEASIWSILHPIKESDSSLPSIPYGCPMVNQTFHVLDKTLEPCPVWVAGDLYIGGIGLARGYWRDEEKTSASFITHPRTGERLYKTGDIGRYLPDGDIEFLGRRDFQVKIQGFRIELGEIEAALVQHSLVRSAVVTVAGETSEARRLIGFIVLEQESDTPQAVNQNGHQAEVHSSLIQDVRRFLGEKLPGYMIPSDFIVVDEIPITPNGKVDRKALQALEPAVGKPASSYAPPTTDMERTLASIFQEVLGIEQLDTEANFFELGANSLHIVKAYNRLRESFDEHVPIVQFFKYPTIRSLATNLRPKQDARTDIAPSVLSSHSAKTTDQNAPDLFAPHRQDSTVSNDIAVIGMSCRFPGAPNLSQFWHNLRTGTESITTFSDDELLASGIHPSVLKRPDYVKAGAIIDDIESFDAAFFGMSPREAEMTDPQQRIFMEVAWEALEDAGYDPQRYGGAIGVFAGANLSTYLLFNLNTRLASSVPGLPLLLGNDKDYLATHVSYKLNLRGPSMSIQTACSTSLVAIHMACQSLLNGESDMALAGGITINVPQKTGYQYQQGGPVSPDGHCRTFDAQAQGTILGNGVGVVVLKRLADALRDGDCIDAVVKGSAINNDGALKVGFTAPSVDGQAEVIARALARARVEPESIGYVEAHGTATPLGDPIEVSALSLAFSSQTLPPASCALGSVKSNLGHLDSAAGVAGFIKAVLSLKHAQLLPSLHCTSTNPRIEFERTPFYVNTRLQPWEVREGAKRRAGVSSFGIGGTNAHLVLEEAPDRVVHAVSASPQLGHAAEAIDATEAVQVTGAPESSVYVLPLSARHPQALRDVAAAYRDLLTALPDASANINDRLRDICYSASTRRAHHPAHRLACVARSAQQLRSQLDSFLTEQPAAGLFSSSTVPARAATAPRVVFIFPGQGAQWWRMGRELLHCSTVFRQSIQECAELFSRHTQNWQLWQELTQSEELSRLDSEDIELTQCALFAVQVSLARLWQSYGVKPSMVVGHSMGEVAAAAVAGLLTLEEAVRVIYARSRLLQQATGRGAMAAVELSEAEAEAVVATTAGRVSVAAVNGRRASVLSGEREAVEQLMAELEGRGVMVRRIRTSGVAGHSPEVEGVGQELERVLAGVRGRASEVAMVSSVEGRVVRGEEVDAGYWRRNVRERVRFAEAMREAVREGAEVYVEMNAHPVLGLWVREAVEEERGAECVVVGALRREREEREVTVEGLAEVYARGVEVDWAEMWKAGTVKDSETETTAAVAGGGVLGGAGRYVRIPGYAWQRQRFWIDPPRLGRLVRDEHESKSKRSAHPLLARRVQSSIYPNTHFWEVDLEAELLPYLQDHRIQGTIVLPASFYIEMALAAVRELFGVEEFALEEVVFKSALIIHGNQEGKLQLVISIEEAGEASFSFSSLQGRSGVKQEGRWVSHVSGKIRRAQKGRELSAPEGFLTEEIKGRCREVVSAAEHYRELEERGLQYGASFRCVRQVFRNGEEAIAPLQLPDDIGRTASSYIVHPVLLDSGLQVLAAIRGADGVENERDIYLPVDVQRIRLNAPLSQEGACWGYGLLRGTDESARDEIEGDLYILNENGSVALEARGIRARRLVAARYEGGREDISDWFYRIEWMPATTTRAVRDDVLPQASDDARWLIFTDGGGFGDLLASHIKERGERIIRVSTGERYRKVDGESFELDPSEPEHFRMLFEEAFGEAKGSIRGIIHLWSLDAVEPDAMSLDALQAAHVLTCGSVLHMVQAVVGCERAPAPRVWLVTRGAQVVEEGGRADGLAQSAVWGLGKVIGIEHDELRCTRIDLDSAVSSDEAKALWEELLGAFDEEFDEEEIAFRNGKKFVSRLTRYAPADALKRFYDADEMQAAEAAGLIRSAGTYLITGGLGGLGLTVAEWLVEQGARHLVLMGRNEASAKAQEAIAGMRRAGACVTIARADVSEREQVAAVLEEIERVSPGLAGVVHAAGILDDGLLLTLDWERFEKVTSPKIEGAWNLHSLLQDKPLDFFVLFSSAGSMLGSPGQGNHVAGNAFLDALAHYRRARGLAGLSINWSQWSEVGEAAHVNRGGRLASQGIPALTLAQALRALELLLLQDAPQVGVMKFDLQQWAGFYPQAANSSLLRQVAGERRGAKAEENESYAFRASLAGAGSERRRLSMLEEFLKKEVAWVLRLAERDVARDVPFSDIGLDSLRSLELRNRLEHALGLTLPATLVWQFPTVEALAPHLAEKMGLPLAADDKDDEAPAVDTDTRHQSFVAHLEQLSEEEALALLTSRVETLQ